MVNNRRKNFCAGLFLLFFLLCPLGNNFSGPFITVALADEPVVQSPTAPEQNTGESGTNAKLPDFVLNIFNIGVSIGFVCVLISLAVGGAMYALSPVSANLRASAKDRISGAVSGLLILVLTYLILTTINPQLTIFKLDKISVAPLPTITETRIPGVYFYKSGCSDSSAKNYTTSLPDLGNLKNNVRSVSIVQDAESQVSYMTILYDNPGFWGKCFYINGDQACQSVSPFAASASIYKYEASPSGNGVTFYRESYSGGGSYTVPNSQIRGVYIKKLDTLHFIDRSGKCNVPEEEQDCVKYDKKGKCANGGRRCPALSGENILSVDIDGDYLVLFVYFAPSDRARGPWTFCQEFPTANDANRSGPQQIKWQNIRNNNAAVVPNYVVIFPIKS